MFTLKSKICFNRTDESLSRNTNVGRNDIAVYSGYCRQWSWEALPRGQLIQRPKLEWKSLDDTRRAHQVASDSEHILNNTRGSLSRIKHEVHRV